MNTAELLQNARADGVTVHLDADQLSVRGNKTVIDRWLPMLRSHRDELRAWLTAETLIRSAMRACDYWHDGTEARERMVRDCLDTAPQGRDALRQHFERAYPKEAGHD